MTAIIVILVVLAMIFAAGGGYVFALSRHYRFMMYGWANVEVITESRGFCSHDELVDSFGHEAWREGNWGRWLIEK